MDETRELVNYRLIEYKKKKEANTIIFGEETIEILCERAGGVPRKIIELARKSFRVAAERNVQEVTVEIIQEIPT